MKAAVIKEMAAALEGFINHGFCFSCGCDLWNTQGCPGCRRMRAAYTALVSAGLRKPLQFAPFLEADETNRRNRACAAGWDLLKALKAVEPAFEHSKWGDKANGIIKAALKKAEFQQEDGV